MTIETNNTDATIAEKIARTTPTKKPAAATTKKPAAAKTKKPAAAKTKKPKTFTSVDIAREYNINPKTLRARIRRNIDKWSPLFANDERHVFVDNATTRKKVAALLNA
jgi:uncharacterized protein YjcR